ncbi:MAG: DUF4418 family protein [Lachnospiraceae bacterium]|nr:DUF4418 family protein [Lachnospiraceae bacterium]
MNLKSKVFSLFSLIAGLLLSAGVSTVFRACSQKEDGTWMNCHDAQTAVLILGLLIAVVSLISLVSRAKSAVLNFSCTAAGLAIVAMLVPGTIIHMCMMDSMRCYAVMQPFVRIMSVVVIVLSALQCVMAAKAAK